MPNGTPIRLGISGGSYLVSKAASTTAANVAAGTAAVEAKSKAETAKAKAETAKAENCAQGGRRGGGCQSGG